MGSHATLKIGGDELACKYYVPPVMTFLFTHDDFIAVPYENQDIEEREDGEAEDKTDDGEPEDQGWSVLGYRTTGEGAIRNLESFGYTLDFFARPYEDFTTSSTLSHVGESSRIWSFRR